MKEEIKWSYSKEAEELKNELKTLFQGKCKLYTASYGFLVEPKHFGFWRWWVAKIDIDNKTIRVADCRYYSILKEFGKKHNFNSIIKEYKEKIKK